LLISSRWRKDVDLNADMLGRTFPKTREVGRHRTRPLTIAVLLDAHDLIRGTRVLQSRCREARGGRLRPWPRPAWRK